MKYRHACPKCESPAIVRVPGTRGAYGSGNNIPIGRTVFNSVLVTRYVCANCGFVEEWIDQPEDIEKIRKRYQG